MCHRMDEWLLHELVATKSEKSKVQDKKENNLDREKEMKPEKEKELVSV